MPGQTSFILISRQCANKNTQQIVYPHKQNKKAKDTQIITFEHFLDLEIIPVGQHVLKQIKLWLNKQTNKQKQQQQL